MREFRTANSGGMRLRRTGHDTRIARRTQRDRAQVCKIARKCCICACIISCSEKAGRSAYQHQSKTLPRRAQCSAGFLHARFLFASARQDRRSAANFLLTGPDVLLEEPIYYYNMGCYEALLGNVDEARDHLKISFEMDASFRELAKKIPISSRFRH